MMRRGTSNYNPSAASRRGAANPYSYILNDNSNIGDDDGLLISQSIHVRILGPLAPFLLSGDPEELQNCMRIYALCVIGTSTFFWLWALYNTLHLRSSGGFDLGVVSFLGSGVAAAFLLRSSLGGKCYDRNQRFGCCGKKDPSRNNADEVDIYGIRKQNESDDAPSHAPPGTYLRTLVVLSQLTVVANYMLGLLFAFTAGTRVYMYFATYCFLFSILWTIVAYAGWVLVAVYREAVGRAYGDEVLNGAPRPALCSLRTVLLYLTRNQEGFGNTANDYDEEEDDIDEELRALYEGRGGYTNA